MDIIKCFGDPFRVLIFNPLKLVEALTGLGYPMLPLLAEKIN